MGNERTYGSYDQVQKLREQGFSEMVILHSPCRHFGALIGSNEVEKYADEVDYVSHVKRAALPYGKDDDGKRGCEFDGSCILETVYAVI